VESRNIADGTKLYFGAPAQPMAPTLVSAISGAVASVAGISEAHLPQCLIEGDKAARQVLAIVVSPQADISGIAHELGLSLRSTLTAGVLMDILPFRDSAVPTGVREARCQIYPLPKKQWWKVR
jgi:hypothetical protein